MTISKKNLLAILFFSSFFLILHIETLSILGIKISYIWKFALLLYLILKIKYRYIWSGYYPLIALSFISLLNNDIALDTPTAGVNLFNILIIPLIGIHLTKFNKEKLNILATRISLFIALSFIPYALGLMESYGQAYDLENFGGSFGLVGAFATAHGASLSLAAAILVILDRYLFDKKYRAYYAIILVIGLLFLIQTHVRTGLLMLAIGVLVMLACNLKNIKKIQLALIPAITIFIWLPTTDNFEVLTNRIIGAGKYTSEESITDIGSGRGGIYIASINVYSEFNLKELLIGTGKATQMDLIASKIGLRIGSHNAFLDLLLAHGIIGLCLFLYFLLKTYTRIIKYHKGKDRNLALSLYWAYIGMCMVQGFNWLFVNILLLLALTICMKSTPQTSSMPLKIQH